MLWTKWGLTGKTNSDKDSQYVLNREIEKVWREVIKQEKRKESTLKQKQEPYFHGMRECWGYLCATTTTYIDYFNLKIESRWLIIWVEVCGKAPGKSHSSSPKLHHLLHTNLSPWLLPFLDLSMWLFLLTSWQWSCMWRLPSPYQAQDPVSELFFQSFGCLLLFQ